MRSIKAFLTILATTAATLGVTTAPASAAAIACKITVTKLIGGTTRLGIVSNHRTSAKVHSFIAHYRIGLRNYSRTHIPTSNTYTVETLNYTHVQGWQSGQRCTTWVRYPGL